MDSQEHVFSWGSAAIAGWAMPNRRTTWSPTLRSCVTFLNTECPRSLLAVLDPSLSVKVGGLFSAGHQHIHESTMYLEAAWNLCCQRTQGLACGKNSIFMAAYESTISWRPSLTLWELGYRIAGPSLPPQLSTGQHSHRAGWYRLLSFLDDSERWKWDLERDQEIASV